MVSPYHNFNYPQTAYDPQMLNPAAYPQAAYGDGIQNQLPVEQGKQQQSSPRKKGLGFLTKAVITLAALTATVLGISHASGVKIFPAENRSEENNPENNPENATAESDAMHHTQQPDAASSTHGETSTAQASERSQTNQDPATNQPDSEDPDKNPSLSNTVPWVVAAGLIYQLGPALASKVLLAKGAKAGLARTALNWGLSFVGSITASQVSSKAFSRVLSGATRKLF
ncbi:MAG: hypothetical protein AAGI66_03225 [Cyanobacteria bacterium P01_H01_bin.74]